MTMGRFMAWILAILGFAVAAVAGAYFWASSGWDGDDPAAASRADIVATAGAVPASAPAVLKVLTWNVAFGGGTGESTDVHTAEEVRRNLAAVAAGIRLQDPDIVFLQEVDRRAARSGDIDQFQELRQATGFPYGCFVTTWKLNHLPFPYWPPSRQIGRIHSGQAILSRFPIEACARHPLPQPSEQPSWYNRMYLHRCLQTARLRIGPDRVLDVVNVHLEAYGQANREDQARILAGLVGAPAAGMPLIVAGDFNAVPSGASMKGGFPDEPTDFTTDRTLEIIRAGTGLREVFLDDAPEVPEAATLTFPAKAETRRLDFVFARSLPASTRRETIATAASDHRPIVAVFPGVSSSDAPSGSPRTSP